MAAGPVGSADEPRWQRSPHVLWRRSLDAVLLVAPGTATPRALTDLGPVVWALLAEERSIESVMATLLESGDLGIPIAEREVRDLIAQLVEWGAIRPVAEPA